VFNEKSSAHGARELVAFILSGIEYTAGILSAKSDTENAWLPHKRQPTAQLSNYSALFSSSL